MSGFSNDLSLSSCVAYYLKLGKTCILILLKIN